jgi:hypothetical protein
VVKNFSSQLVSRNSLLKKASKTSLVAAQIAEPVEGKAVAVLPQQKREKCIKLLVPDVEQKQKYHLNLLEKSLFIVEIVIKPAQYNKSNLVRSFLCFGFYFT